MYLGPQIDKAKAYNANTVNINVKQTELELNLAGVHPAELAQLPLYWAVNYLSAKGINLKTGQVFITGSYCGVVELNTDQLTTVSYEDLGSVSTTFLSK
ncbi:hypothetical protein P4S63_21530 [Pseudoalteromonas sp. B193]